MGKHEDECKKFYLARKFNLIHCVQDNILEPLIFYMEYEDPEDRVDDFYKLPKKKMLIIKSCPFCGKILVGE